MPNSPRIALQIGPDDPFWVQVREQIWRRAEALGLALIDVDMYQPDALTLDEQAQLVENMLVYELDVLICNNYPEALLGTILERGIHVLYLLETPFRRPGFTSRHGLFAAAATVGALLCARLAHSSAILVVGGTSHRGDKDSGESRLEGFASAIPPDARHQIWRAPCLWTYEDGFAKTAVWLSANPVRRIDAIFGLSDPLALAARDAWRAIRPGQPLPPIVGINGDPLALAAVRDGSMLATVETDVEDIAHQAIEVARRASRGEAVPDVLSHRQQLVTAANVADIAMHKLLSMAELPTRLVSSSVALERQRTLQFRTSLTTDRQLGQTLDEDALSLTIARLICESYGFDRALLLLWRPETSSALPFAERANPQAAVVVGDDDPLGRGLRSARPVFIPDTLASQRFAPDPRWPQVRSRVVVPVRRAGVVVGALDLHYDRPASILRAELEGLELLATQLGSALHNAALYSAAIAARQVAQRADQLKTRLLANVSHELRSPLQIILGYSQLAREALRSDAPPTADDLVEDFEGIERAGEYLQRLISDLLDLSRAEIGALELVMEQVDPARLLTEVFEAMTESAARTLGVIWRLELPDQLPTLAADPVRLRQIVLNLLHNAQKFTVAGAITLGAALRGGEIEIWVRDTGVGIASERLAMIFEPFVTFDTRVGRSEGIGLGLSITRQLVLLHHGRMAVESEVDRGSVFRVLLPLAEGRPRPASGESIAHAGRGGARAPGTGTRPSARIGATTAQPGSCPQITHFAE